MDIQDPQNTPETEPKDGEATSQEAVAQSSTVGDEAPADASLPTAAAGPAPSDTEGAAALAEDASDVASASLADTELDSLEITTRLPARAKATVATTPEAEAPLGVGSVIGSYRIVSDAPAGQPGVLFLAEPVEPKPPEEELPGVRFAVREVRADDATDDLAHIVAMGLQHPVLLAPVALARESGRLLLISAEVADERGELIAPMSQGERLRAVDALRAGIELADALATLHRNGLAHLHISPEVVTLHEGRIYLGGIEKATVVGSDEEAAKPLYTRDANYLARTMGMVGGVTDTPQLDETTSAHRSLREIARRGEAGGFTKAEELAESFALALQALASAGAGVGADLRSVRLVVSADAATTVGLVRAANQDAYGVAYFNIQDDAAADAPVGVFLIADGMGGEAKGEIASRLVARAVTTEMTRQFSLPATLFPALNVLDVEDAAEHAPRLPLAQALEAAVKEANRQTRAFGQRLQATTGSTVTALAISGARAAIAHLGDSRAYLLRDNQLLQLTEDHSLLARMEAVQHPLLDDPNFLVPRSVLYRSVGQEDDITPDMMEFVVTPNDRIVLCSDGLWDELPPQMIGQTLAEAISPRACAADLVSLANAAGGNDNSTAVVIFIDAQPVDDALSRRGLRSFGEGHAKPAEDTDSASSEAKASESTASAE